MHARQTLPSRPSFSLLAATISRGRTIAVKITLCPGRSTVTAGKVCATGAARTTGGTATTLEVFPACPSQAGIRRASRYLDVMHSRPRFAGGLPLNRAHSAARLGGTLPAVCCGACSVCSRSPMQRQLWRRPRITSRAPSLSATNRRRLRDWRSRHRSRRDRRPIRPPAFRRLAARLNSRSFWHRFSRRPRWKFLSAMPAK